MDKLPKVFVSPINKEINNQQRTYRSNSSEEDRSFNVSDIDKLFYNNYNSVAGVKAYIKTNQKEYDTVIVTKKDNFILTIDNEKIYIDDILDIKKIK